MTYASRPRDFGTYLRWFLAAWAEELPDRLHARGVWRDYGRDAVGGSTLGSPRLHDAFRSYIEGSPYQTDYDPRLDADERNAVYVRPMHRALCRMTGGYIGPLHEHMPTSTFMAHALFALACSGGDWRTIGLRFAMPAQVAGPYFEEALRRLWNEYERLPEARAIA